MVILVLVIFIIILLVNLVVYSFGFGFFFAALSLLVSTKPLAWPAWLRSVWTRSAIAVCLTIALAIILPAHENVARHRRREEATRGDLLRTERLQGVHQLALLYNPDSVRQQTSGMQDANHQNPEPWQNLLLSHAVDSVMIGRNATFGAELDPAAIVKRYRIEHRPWCETIWTNDQSGRSRLEALARLASGECLVSEEAKLGDADAVVAIEFLPNDGIKRLHRTDEDVTANRIDLYQRDGTKFRLVSRETHVGGSDWFVPVLYGMSSMGFIPAMIFGGGAQFLTINDHDPTPPDLHTRFVQWGLSAEDQPKVSGEAMRQTVMMILSRPNIPEDSAASYFLGAYLWNKAWDGPDRTLAAAIIRDPRVTRFPWYEQPTGMPTDLVRPIAERMLGTDLSPSLTPSQLSWNRYVVRRMAGLIRRLPICGSLPARELIEQADHDAARHALVAEATLMVERDIGDKRCKR